MPLYDRTLSQIEGQAGESSDVDECKAVFRSMSIASQPLRLQELWFAADLDQGTFECEQNVQALLEGCGSFVTIRHDTVYFVHQSARDYFAIGPGQRIFHGGYRIAHGEAAVHCLDWLTSNLHMDICEFGDPSILASEVDTERKNACLGPALRYACRYWSYHVENAGLRQSDSLVGHETGRIEVFFRTAFIYWIECLSLLGEVSRGTQDLHNLDALIQVCLHN